MAGPRAQRPSDHAALKQKQRAIRAGFPDDLGLRVHRAISWLGRAERESGDPDLRFILLWISFNAAYARDIGSEEVRQRDAFRAFFGRLVRLDAGQEIYGLVWERFSQEIRLLLDNRFLFQPFWKHQNGLPGSENWARELANDRRAIARAMAGRDTVRLLAIIFERLYVLRNQLVHGGATWNGSVNRDEVRNGAALLGRMMPLFIDLMMDHPHEDWGRPYYPVVA